MVTIQPVIVLRGLEGDTNIFMAINPADGNVLWSHKLEGDTAATVTRQGDGVLIASRQKSGGLRIARFGFDTGPGWHVTLKPGSVHEEGAPLLLQEGRRVVSVGADIGVLDARQGRLL